MTILDRVLNGYKGADVSGLLLEELRTENTRLNARLSRMAADLAQNRLETDKLRRSVRRAKPTYSWLVERAQLDAKGQVIRLLPFAAVWLLLTGGVVWLLGLTFPYLLIGFALLTAATFIKMNGQEFDHSRNGLERHRVNRAADLRRTELENTHELKKMALSAYLQIAKAQYGVNDDNGTD